MVTIAKDNEVVTLINVFTVAPEDQQRLVDVLADATRAVMRKQPGFVSANIHRSLDGTRVTNYAQWRSTEAFETMLQNQEAAEHMGGGGQDSREVRTAPIRSFVCRRGVATTEDAYRQRVLIHRSA